MKRGQEYGSVSLHEATKLTKTSGERAQKSRNSLPGFGVFRNVQALLIVKNKKGYLEWLKVKIERLYNCDAAYRQTVPVHVVFNGKTVWPPEVEVFGLIGHPTVKLAYAWGTRVCEWGDLSELSNELGELLGPVVVLEIPPLDSAQKAVQVHAEKAEKKLRELARVCKKQMDEQFSEPYPATN